jgi:hypothetical protein
MTLILFGFRKAGLGTQAFYGTAGRSKQGIWRKLETAGIAYDAGLALDLSSYSITMT